MRGNSNNPCSCPRFRFGVMMTTLSLALLILPSFNLLTIFRLQQGMLREVTNHATQTTILISINYFLLNCVFVVGNLYFRLSTPPTTEPSAVELFAEFIVYRVALPLNSAINPLIYLTRSVPMRDFVCNGFDVRRTRGRRLLDQVAQNGTMMLRQITQRNKSPTEQEVL